MQKWGRKILLLLFITGVIFTHSSCTAKELISTGNAAQTQSSLDSQTTESQTETIIQEILKNDYQALDSVSKNKINASFLEWMQGKYGGQLLAELHCALDNRDFQAESWHQLTGNTFHVLWDTYQSEVQNKMQTEHCKKLPDTKNGDFIINIVGDVSLADNWRIMPRYDERGKGVYGILSEETVQEMRSADILLVNNEFTFSDRGTALEKQYTFRASPERVQIYQELGVDIVSLANNHAYDYGPLAFADTLETLSTANIPYIGGGKNMEEAQRPYYFIINGRKIAFVAATRAEKYIITPEAAQDSAGVLRAYDPSLFLDTIAEAKRNSDYVIAYIHWGTENSHDLEEVQRETGRAYLDAGADIVVGAHAHVLQGIEFYHGKPIVYNLGNFIFNAQTIDTGMLKIHMDAHGKASYEFLTCLQENCYTKIVDGDERKRILTLMERISCGVTFDQNGFFREKTSS